jgi:hypothetical protein
MDIIKDWYTLPEIASKWGCGIYDLIELGQQQKIQICADWKTLTERFSLSFLSKSFVFFESERFFFTAPHEGHINLTQDYFILKELNTLINPIVNPKQWARYQGERELIPELHEVIIESNPLTARLFVINSNLLFSIKRDSLNLTPSDDPTSLISLGFLSHMDIALFEGGELQTDDVVISIKEMIITNEERTRFEKEVNMQRLQSSETSTHIVNTETDEDDDSKYPINLVVAESVYIDVWKNFPENMNKPLRAELEEVIRSKGITSKTVIDSIITISTPDHITLGGKRKPDLLPWDINKY